MKYLKYILPVILLLSLTAFSISTFAQTDPPPKTCVVFFDDFEDGEIEANPTWIADNTAWEIIDGQLHVNGADGGVVVFESAASITATDYLELSFVGLIKSDNNPDATSGIVLGLYDELFNAYGLGMDHINPPATGDESFGIQIYSPPPDDNLVYIQSDFAPEVDTYYQVRGVRDNGVWTLYVDGIEIASGIDPLEMNNMSPIEIRADGDVIIDNVQVIADCQNEPPPETCVVFYEDFEDGNIDTNPTWTVDNAEWEIINGELHMGLVSAEEYPYATFESFTSITATDYLEYSYTGLVKQTSASQTEHMMGMGLLAENTFVVSVIGIVDNFDTAPQFVFSVNDNEESTSRIDGAEYDVYYHFRTVRESGVWTFYVDNVEFSTIDDPLGSIDIASVVFQSRDSIIIDNIQVIADCTNVNQPPTAHDQNVVTDEDVAVNITLTGSDVDGDSLSFSVLTNPTNGVLSGSEPNLIYTPNANFYGNDSFTFEACDLEPLCDTGTISITVVPVNDAPILDAIGNQSVNEGDALELNLSASDIDNVSLTFSLNPEAPAFVSLSDNNDGTAVLTISPTFSDAGTHEATISVSDGDLSDSESITINVADVNQPPTADDQDVSTDEDVALDITLTGFDSDGDALIFNVLTTPTNGGLSGTLPNLAYTPNANFYGNDNFIFEVCDPELLCDTGTISITVISINDAPVALDDDTYEVNNDVSLIVVAPGVLDNDADIEGDILSAILVDAPTNGNVILYADGSFSYTAYLGFVGSDTFTYRASDGVDESNIATVTINVLNASTAPVALGEEYVVNMNGVLTISAPGVLANDTDIDGDTLIPILVSDVNNGRLKLRPNGSLRYTPDNGFSGIDSFTYMVFDDSGLNSNLVTVIINVISGNYTPANVNLLVNPNFDNGFKDWELSGAYVRGVRDAVTIYSVRRYATAIVYQSVAANIPVGSPVEAHVDLSNHSSETRLVELRITSLSTYNSMSCSVLVPPNTPAQTLTMTGTTDANYSGALFEVLAYAPDEVFVTMDNTGLYWRPDETYATIECTGF